MRSSPHFVLVILFPLLNACTNETGNTQAALNNDDDFVNKIEHFSSRVTLLDEVWSATNLKWSNDQFKLILAKTNLDLATVKNWIVNDLNSFYGGRAF